jgi:hypothetical protein
MVVNKKTQFSHGFAAAQHTRIPRLHAVSYLILYGLFFEFFLIFKIVS